MFGVSPTPLKPYDSSPGIAFAPHVKRYELHVSCNSCLTPELIHKDDSYTKSHKYSYSAKRSGSGCHKWSQ